jgi:hypothetical protein
LHVVAGLPGRKRFVERSLGVRVLIVLDQRDPLDLGVACLEQMGDFLSPIVLGGARLSRDLTEARERFRKHQDACRSLGFVLVIDPLWMPLGSWEPHACLADQLHRRLVHARDRALGI